MATFEVVVDYVIFFPRFGQKKGRMKKRVREPARLKT